MELQEKILNAFMGKVVRKDLAFRVKGNLPVPTYVLEYLLGQYCACDDEDIIEEGLEKVKGFIGEPFDTNVVITENGVKYKVNIEEGQKSLTIKSEYGEFNY